IQRDGFTRTKPADLRLNPLFVARHGSRCSRASGRGLVLIDSTRKIAYFRPATVFAWGQSESIATLERRGSFSGGFMRRNFVRGLLLGCALLALPAVTFAQEAVLTGTVTDSTGAVLPGVTVVA